MNGWQIFAASFLLTLAFFSGYVIGHLASTLLEGASECVNETLPSQATIYCEKKP